jgi:GT2 family glycosyltransferase/2-polyprenyl-3-methyl-5-hydroxy-6-metoxy-1,4-benzoquinol methylase/glycosyltransferase involved in cell wall biosynthesis
MDEKSYMNARSPRASIVVLCYNGLEEVTKPCIASILANTPSGDYELIIVDNASVDGTAAWIEQLAGVHTHIRSLCNTFNRGYAGGNNDGMRLARGEHIVLLNNDTLVPPGWLDAMLRLLETRPEVGLAGPVTNSAGNEQRVELHGLTQDNYEGISGAYVQRHREVWFTTEKLGFFCVAMRRNLPEKIGYLDENFGVGMFEDDDYCARVKQAGLSLAVAEDCFVFHKGSVSFRKLAFDDYRALFERNRAYFFRKHKIEWALTDLAFAYLDKFALDLQALQNRVDTVPPEVERLAVRLENFRHLLVQIYQAEIAGKTTSEGAVPPNVRRALWQTRRRHFQQLVVDGNWRDRAEFVRRVYHYVRRRLPGYRPIAAQPNVTKALVAIRNAHPGAKLVVFPATVDFHYMEQRPQQLARAFAEAGYLVLYGTLNHKVDRVDITEAIAPNLYLVHEHAFPLLTPVFGKENSTYYCLWPNNIKHLDYLACSTVLYDYMDELSLLELPAEVIDAQHRDIMRRADLITVSAEKLFRQLPEEVKSKALLLPNAVADRFIEALQTCDSVPAELNVFGSDATIIGYYGAIAKWLDFDLLTQLAKAMPHVQIVLVGPIMKDAEIFARNLSAACGNVHILPARSQMELVPFLKRFDVCIIPFIKNDVTDAVSPVKLFEYFAADKPVVTTALMECQRYPSVNIAYDINQFIAYVEASLIRPLPSTQTFARANTWRSRVKEIEAMLSHKCELAGAISIAQKKVAVHLEASRPDLAGFYAEQYSVQEITYWQPVLKWIRSAPSADAILDIGPAYGTLLTYASLCHPKSILHACDAVPLLSKSLIEALQIDYRVINIEKEPIDFGKRFDLIIFTEILEHLNFAPLPTLQRLRSMLTPGGRCVLTTPDALEWGRVLDYYPSLDAIPEYIGQASEWIDGHIWQYEKTELDLLLNTAGFSIESFSYAPGMGKRHLCYLLSCEAIQNKE